MVRPCHSSPNSLCIFICVLVCFQNCVLTHVPVGAHTFRSLLAALEVLTAKGMQVCVFAFVSVRRCMRAFVCGCAPALVRLGASSPRSWCFIASLFLSFSLPRSSSLSLSLALPLSLSPSLALSLFVLCVRACVEACAPASKATRLQKPWGIHARIHACMHTDKDAAGPGEAGGARSLAAGA